MPNGNFHHWKIIFTIRFSIHFDGFIPFREILALGIFLAEHVGTACDKGS